MGSGDKVEHDYHDYSKEVDTGEAAPSITDGAMRTEQNFPVKLHYMLSELESDGLDDIVSWQPHGRCFVVHKQKEFVDKILPL
jgi:hypothetical protein